MTIQLIAGPLIGAIIGYITNYIAIKMLFRPLEPKYLFGVQLPFTPGIIPRRKQQLGDALGSAVFRRFFGWDDFAAVLLSDSFADKIVEGVEECILNADPKDLIERIPLEVKVRMREELSEQVRHTMVVKGYAGAAKLASETAADMLDDMMENASREELARALSGITDMKAPDIKPYIKNIYAMFMNRYVKSASESVDIVGIISGKVKLMEAGEIEVLALDIIDRELKMVIRFGAVLGAMIGAVNSLIYYLN